MQKLASNQVFTLKVSSIENAAQQFPKNGTGETIYCHFYTLEDEFGEQYPCQMCNEYPAQQICEVGQLVKAQVKTFTKNRYTLSALTVIDIVGMQKELKRLSESDKPVGEPIKTLPNPNIAGTILDRSMAYAMQYYKDNEVPFEKVTDYADQMVAWFRLNLQ